MKKSIRKFIKRSTILVGAGIIAVVLIPLLFLIIFFSKNFVDTYILGDYSFRAPSGETLMDWQDVKKEAAEKGDPALCMELPESYKYYGKEGMSEEYSQTITRQENPRADCLIYNYETVYDLEACDLLDSLDKNLGDNCRIFLAEVHNDVSLCDELSGYYYNDVRKSYTVEACRANVTRDYAHCYDIAKESDEPSTYSHQTGYCISEVVLRTGDHTSCLEIDSEKDFGLGWGHYRNECLVKATYTTKLAYCNQMVEDDYANLKEKCFEGVEKQMPISWLGAYYYSKIPPRIGE